MNSTRDIVAPDLTINPNDRGDISIIATALQSASFGALTRREAIAAARVIAAKAGCR